MLELLFLIFLIIYQFLQNLIFTIQPTRNLKLNSDDYLPGVKRFSSRGNAEPNHIVVLYYE